MPKGTAFTMPVSQLLRPNDLTSCGIQSASDVEAPAAPGINQRHDQNVFVGEHPPDRLMRDPRRSATLDFQFGDQPPLLLIASATLHVPADRSAR